MEIIFTRQSDNMVLARCSREDGRKFKDCAGFWRACAPNMQTLVRMVEAQLGHAGFRLKEETSLEWEQNK